jgi:hypothetical protein
MRYWMAALALLALAACQPKPTYDYRTGTVLLDESFDQSFAWESYQNADLGVNLRVENGAYHMTVSGGGYIWGLNAQPHEDVVFTAQSAQLSDFNNNAYGLMCRADPNNDGDGYYFLISGDGYWSIRRGRGGTIEALVEFERTDAVYQGHAINSIRVLCIEDYLALYVNDYFVGEARDSLYRRGYAGFVVAAAEEGEAEVTFDAARIVEATLVK